MVNKDYTAIISDTRDTPEEADIQTSKSLLWGDQKNLFNKKEFADIKGLVDSIESLIETEKDSNKKILSELNEIIQRDREDKKEREKEIRRFIQDITKKINFISDQTTEKEVQLKKEVDVLQQSIKMIQTNLSAFGRGNNKKQDLPEENAPSLINREELEKMTMTVRNIKAMLDEEKTKEKSIDKQVDDIVLQRDELIKGFEHSTKKQIQKMNAVISNVNTQTTEKEEQLKREIEILQQSIRLIKERLPITDSISEEEPATTQKTTPTFYTQKSSFSQPPISKEESEEDEEQILRREKNEEEPRFSEEETEEDTGLEIELETESSSQSPKYPQKRKKPGRGFQFFRK